MTARLLLCYAGAMCLGLPIAVDPSVRTPGECLMSADLSGRLVALLQGTERLRLLRWQKALASSIDIVVESCPAAEVMGIQLYRGYNSYQDPPWVYVVAVDQEGALYRIRGFETKEYGELVRRWLGGGKEVTASEVATIVVTYFSKVEGWEPGLVESADDLGAVRRMVADASRGGGVQQTFKGGATLPRIRREGAAVAVAGTLFDAASGRVECVEVELSLARGLVVRSREVLIDSPRLRF